MIAVRDGYTTSGKVNYKILPSSGLKANPILGQINIPCGQCIECRMQYARQWADRCMLELLYHDSSYFLTLTYDNEHVVWTEEGHLTLVKKDLQDFHKRLRSRLGYPIRYYASGEYGDTTKRPHYHDIVFGLKLDDLQFYKKSETGCNLYKSEFLNAVWTNGEVIVGEVTWESCAYTARYVVKKHKGLDSGFYEAFGIEPEFVLMSRKPGIGRPYYDAHPEMFEHNSIFVKTKNGGLKVKAPRYFEKLLEVDNPLLLDDIKQRKSLVGASVSAAKLSQTELDFTEHLTVEEVALKNRYKIFERSQI